jgi:hypothetical protein
MADTTRPPQGRTGTKTSGYCKLDYGHQTCFPGPVMVGKEEIIPRSCFCPCHEKAEAR